MLSETEGKFLTMHEFAKAAKNRLDANIWDYLTGATETETTMRRNRLALDTLAFRPRVLRDVSTIDTTSEMFGKKLRLPVALAPVGGLESFGANGVPLMLGGTPPALADKVKLAAHGVRIALQGHAPSFAAMAAVHATLKALRDGTPPGKLPGLADAALMKAAMREDDYARWTREFLAG